MNCLAAQRLVSSARDGVLGAPEQAALAAHLAGCAGCRRMSESLSAAAQAWRESVASAPVPDARLEWQRLQRQLSPSARPAPARRSALWWGLSFAAAAGLVLAVWIPRSGPTPDAGFVEVGEGNSSATVYVDAQSGWLVVWTVSDADRI